MKLTKELYLEEANEIEKGRLLVIRDIDLIKILAKRYCDKHGLKLGGYIGDESFDSWKIQ
jgi:hypothetical protein